MEIDVKKEKERVQGEIKQLNDQVNQMTNQMNLFNQQRQEIINQLIKKQGELELLQRLKTNKEKIEKAP